MVGTRNRSKIGQFRASPTASAETLKPKKNKYECKGRGHVKFPKLKSKEKEKRKKRKKTPTILLDINALVQLGLFEFGRFHLGFLDSFGLTTSSLWRRFLVIIRIFGRFGAFGSSLATRSGDSIGSIFGFIKRLVDCQDQKKKKKKYEKGKNKKKQKRKQKRKSKSKLVLSKQRRIKKSKKKKIWGVATKLARTGVQLLADGVPGVTG